MIKLFFSLSVIVKPIMRLYENEVNNTKSEYYASVTKNNTINTQKVNTEKGEKEGEEENFTLR